MRIPASAVGVRVGPREQQIDARWPMAYAAALGESAPEYFDTTRPGGIRTHPLFPVCYEWPLALDIRAKALSDDVAVRGVHATHRLILHRAPRPGDRLSTTATVAGLERRAPGAYMLLRMETVDANGRPVTTTDYGSLYRGVDCDSTSLSPRGRGQGEGLSGEGRQGEGASSEAWSAEVSIAPTLAHVYTECARIWNPIHTDRAVALAAGLPDIILHGTATLALAVSQTLLHHERGVPAVAREVGCRFGAMVRLPSRLTVRGGRPEPTAEGTVIRFEALAEDGRPAVRDGYIVVESA
jgi:acyl dehydratase